MTKALIRADRTVDENLKEVAGRLARGQVTSRKLWDFLGDVVEGKVEYPVGGKAGEVVSSPPKIDHRLKAAELLLAYGYGKPTTEPASPPRADPTQTARAAVDEVFDQLQRLHRITNPPAAIPEGEATEIL